MPCEYITDNYSYVSDLTKILTIHHEIILINYKKNQIIIAYT